MNLSFNNMLYSLSYALDCVEREILGVATYHGKRVAYLSAVLGKQFKLSEIEMADLAACAILHDNALTEYIESEYKKGVDILAEKEKISLGVHCILGEKNMKRLTLCKEAENAILYHHENADGSGPFQKKYSETPIFAQIIHIADLVDATWNLGDVNEEKYSQIISFVKDSRDVLFSEQCVEAFCRVVNLETIEAINVEHLDDALNSVIKYTEREYSQEELINFSEMFAEIIDHKSKFTKHHSLGIAKKAAEMSRYYGYDSITVTKMYVAGALHDIGKLAVSKTILEKPDTLTPEEYKKIQNHAFQTYIMLNPIKGFEDITRWASLHHEKLNGKGYPFGKTGEELGFNERLMACLDVYQALTEERPYKSGMSHEQAMTILRKMVDNGSLDGKIVNDIDKIYKPKII